VLFSRTFQTFLDDPTNEATIQRWPEAWFFSIFHLPLYDFERLRSEFDHFPLVECLSGERFHFSHLFST